MASKIDSSHVGRIKVNALRVIVYVVIALTILLMFFMPRFITDNTRQPSTVIPYVASVAIVVYIILCCLPFLFALFTVKRICDLISLGSSFSIDTLDYLSQIVICCYIEAAVNVITLVVFPLVFHMQVLTLNLLIIGICGAAAVFTTVLKELVKSAIRLREENELTI